MRTIPGFLLLSFAVIGCNQAQPVKDEQSDDASQESSLAPPAPEPQPAPQSQAIDAPAAPVIVAPEPVSDPRTPISEEKFTATSAQGAGNTVQTYYALLEANKVKEAWELRRPAAGETDESLAKDMKQYQEYHAQVGAPGEIRGAAGSLFVTVPVRVYGRTNDGAAFERGGLLTLRRSNDVPGATVSQLEWRIESASPADLLK